MDYEKELILDNQVFERTTLVPDHVIKEHYKEFYESPSPNGYIWEPIGEPEIIDVGNDFAGNKQYRVVIHERQYKIKGRSR